MVVFKALTTSLMLTAILAVPTTTYNDVNGFVDLYKIQKKADRAIQGVRDLRQGRMKKGLKSKIEEIAAEIIEQKVAEVMAEFWANYYPSVPEQPETTEQAGPVFPTTFAPTQSQVDYCDPSPCVNGACVNSNNSFICECDAGWEGNLCDLNIDNCASDPCANGVCIDGIDSFTCECDAGWEGDLCDINSNECASNPCANGVCIDGIDSFTCDCDAGWEGDLCDINIDDCNPNACQNGATCIDGVNSFTCNCPAGYEGDMCEISTDIWVRYPGNNDDYTQFGSALPYSGLTTRLYYTIDPNLSSWTDCRDTVCPALGGTFASITSQYEQQFFESDYFLDKFYIDYRLIWLGGSDTSSTNGQFRWLYGKSSNDELANTSFVTWNKQPKLNDDYLGAFVSGAAFGKWYDGNAGFAPRRCLCQIRYRNSELVN